MKNSPKIRFRNNLISFAKNLPQYVSTRDGQWSIKGFIDIYKNIFSLSSDTKLVSKIMEIHLFPEILDFAKKHDYELIFAKKQNYYPDITIQDKNGYRFAIDIKTTYRLPDNPYFCNGFTLGSHGEYFINRSSTKNIQFPYRSYCAHFCLGVIYDRNVSNVDETAIYPLSQIENISSVIGNIQFFIAEKWKIASDKSGSGNTANIGSITFIPDILNENGMFSRLGEDWFDEYWMNYKKIYVKTPDAGNMLISDLKNFVIYKKGDADLIVPKRKISKAT